MNKQEIENDIEILKYYEAEPYFFSKDMSALKAFRRAINAYEHQLTNGWIPVSERLPERGIWCLISSKSGMVGEGQYIPNKQCFSYNGHYMDVIAWQPLPEAYKEVSE